MGAFALVFYCSPTYFLFVSGVAICYSGDIKKQKMKNLFLQPCAFLEAQWKPATGIQFLPCYVSLSINYLCSRQKAKMGLTGRNNRLELRVFVNIMQK